MYQQIHNSYLIFLYPFPIMQVLSHNFPSYILLYIYYFLFNPTVVISRICVID